MKRALFITAVLLSGCSRLQSLDIASTGIKGGSFDTSSSNVHYEAVNDKLQFTEHRVVQDPMRGNYERGVWAASKKSTTKVSLVNGLSSANHVSIVFVGDGYLQSQISQYAADVTTNMNLMLEQEPYKTYANYFSFRRVDVVSNISGVSDGVSAAKNTALGMSYNCDGIARLLCINVNLAVSAAQNAGVVDVIFALANSATYGGAGYSAPAVATLAARNPSALELALHEFGHSFAQLTDEYDSAGANVDCNSFANTSEVDETAMKSKQSKWFRWLDLAEVGAFPGSCYAANFFRPTDSSKMRALGNPYDVVNTEQIIIKIYQKVKPIADALPPGTYSSGTIWVTPMQPTDHHLNVTWIIDGKVQSQLNDQNQINLAQMTLSTGQHSVSAKVVDNTPAVRDPDARAQWLTQSLSWTVVMK